MKWFVLRTAPQLEFKAADAVAAMDYETALPYEERVTRKRVGKDRRPDTIKHYVLMRGYVLVKTESSDDVGRIVYRMSYAPKRLITGYIGNYGRPSVVPQWAVDEIEAKSGKRIEDQATPVHRIGDRVTVLGQQAQIIRLDANHATLFGQWLGSEREYKASLQSLQMAG